MDETFSISSLVSKLEHKIKELLKQNKNFEKNFLILENNFRKERLKNNILVFLLKEKTDIDISKLFNETETELSIQDISTNGIISIMVNDEFKNEVKTYELKNNKETVEEPSNDREENEVKNKDSKPKQIFRAIKKAENEETLEETEEKIKKANEIFSSFNECTDISIKDTLLTLENIFNNIGKTRVHKKDLEALKITRFKLLGKMNLDEYTNLITANIDRLKTIFQTKKYDFKKISDFVQKSLNNLDQRLVFFEQYFDSSLLPEEHEKFKIALMLHMEYPKRHIPFNLDDISKKFFNYGLAVLTLKENMIRIFNNPYKFYNIIYINLDKSTYDDPYSFYYLEKINPDGKRHWKIDCRLDDLSRSIAEKIKFYCVNLYRKIYFDIFKDNLYRKDCFEKAVVFKEDLEQLFQNLLKLTRRKEFCLLLQFVIINNCTINPTVQDKFNLMSDDKMNKKNFMNEVDDKKDVFETIKDLFDKITQKEIEEFYETKC